MVHLMGAKLNAPLSEWLQAHPAPVRKAKGRHNNVVYRATKWRIKDRLTEVDIVRLIMAFQTAIATNAIAERYGINVKSVRNLLQSGAGKDEPTR